MLDRELPKSIKRILRELSIKAHEEELRLALIPLSQAFDQWRIGSIGSGDLTELIHEFHQKSARELFVRYNQGFLTANVASAVARGVISKDDVPPEAMPYLEAMISFYSEEAVEDEGETSVVEKNRK